MKNPQPSADKYSAPVPPDDLPRLRRWKKLPWSKIPPCASPAFCARPTPRNLARLRRHPCAGRPRRCVPTETVYGLAADALNPAACQKIFRAKGRPPTDPLIVHVRSLAVQAAEVAMLNPAAEKLAAAFWPGPLTLVLPKRALAFPLYRHRRPRQRRRADAAPPVVPRAAPPLRPPARRAQRQSLRLHQPDDRRACARRRPRHAHRAHSRRRRLRHRRRVPPSSICVILPAPRSSAPAPSPARNWKRVLRRRLQIASRRPAPVPGHGHVIR